MKRGTTHDVQASMKRIVALPWIFVALSLAACQPGERYARCYGSCVTGTQCIRQRGLDGVCSARCTVDGGCPANPMGTLQPICATHAELGTLCLLDCRVGSCPPGFECQTLEDGRRGCVVPIPRGQMDRLCRQDGSCSSSMCFRFSPQVGVCTRSCFDPLDCVDEDFEGALPYECVSFDGTTSVCARVCDYDTDCPAGLDCDGRHCLPAGLER